ncbi:hypothetical protein [Intrasporangium flavum]|uniref:hypothetical protein n=1 Tax=Intrasporangium flavum TaxID=1428657 RepID=UPI00096C805B|nr:hypothetical protein [Intrasporangium flavum]
MGQPERPSDRRTPRSEVARLDDAVAAERRNRVKDNEVEGLVLIREQASSSWVDGVAWIKRPGEVGGGAP